MSPSPPPLSSVNHTALWNLIQTNLLTSTTYPAAIPLCHIILADPATPLLTRGGCHLALAQIGPEEQALFHADSAVDVLERCVEEEKGKGEDAVGMLEIARGVLKREQGRNDEEEDNDDDEESGDEDMDEEDQGSDEEVSDGGLIRSGGVNEVIVGVPVKIKTEESDSINMEGEEEKQQGFTNDQKDEEADDAKEELTAAWDRSMFIIKPASKLTEHDLLPEMTREEKEARMRDIVHFNAAVKKMDKEHVQQKSER